MKIHSNDLKNNIKRMGKVLRSKLTYTLNDAEIEIDNAMLNSVTPSFQSDILKSAMKQLDIDSSVFIPEGTVVNYSLGIMVNGAFEYLNYGNYIVYRVEKQEDTNSYKIVCYDKMLLTMKPYAQMPIKYPITIRSYLNAICQFNFLTFANASDEFANYDKEIQNELYLTSDGKDMNYTFRDVLDELAQVTASTICINDNDELEIRYINDTNDTIDEEFLKDVNVNFGEKYGPINSIVLSRAGGSDNVYLRDEESVTENGLCEIKITDNQIMNFNDRSDYLPDILEKLNGLEYYINDFSSTGICYYEICDRYNVRANGNVYSCVMFNDEVLVTTGLQENVNTPLPKDSETDYTKADKTDRRINQTTLIVDKQNQIIQSLVEKVVDISETKNGSGSLTLENAYKGQLHRLSIKGQISLLFPQSENNLYGYPLVPSDTLTPSSPVPYGNEILYPSSNLFLKSSILLIDDTEYKLDFDFLNYINNDVCDEFVYEDGKCQIIRRVGIDSQGNKYALDNEVIEYRKDIVLEVDKTSVIRLKSFDNAFYEVTYLLENDYTETFATNVRLNSTIEQTAEQIRTRVSKNDLISEINQSADTIELRANRLIIDSDYYKLSEDGKMYSIGGTIGGFNIMPKLFQANISGLYNYNFYDMNLVAMIVTNKISEVSNIIQVLDAYEDNVINSADYVKIKNILNGISENTKIVSGTFEINSDDSKRCLIIKSDTGEEVLSAGLGGLNSAYIACRNFICGEETERYNDWNGVSINGTTGNITCVSLTQTSKVEMKKNIMPFNTGLDIVKNTDIYEYNMKKENDTDKKHIGFIIGDNYNYSEKITSKDNDGAEIYSMVSVLWQAVKEQQEIIENLKQRIEILESKESDL